MKLTAMTLALTLLLAGCGFGGVEGRIHNRTNDYLEAWPVAPLKVPAPLATPNTPSPFVIPKSSAPLTEKKPVSIVPPSVFEE